MENHNQKKSILNTSVFFQPVHTNLSFQSSAESGETAGLIIKVPTLIQDAIAYPTLEGSLKLYKMHTCTRSATVFTQICVLIPCSSKDWLTDTERQKQKYGPEEWMLLTILWCYSAPGCAIRIGHWERETWGNYWSFTAQRFQWPWMMSSHYFMDLWIMKLSLKRCSRWAEQEQWLSHE